MTWSFISKPHAELFGGGQAALALANPIASDLSDMRPSLLPGLVAGLGLLRRGVDRYLAGSVAEVRARRGDLTGLTDDSSIMLAGLTGSIDPRGILLAGVVIGALGVLDDRTVGYFPGAFSAAAQRVLAQLFPDAVVADETDAFAFGLNLVSDGRHVVLNDAASAMAAKLAAAGYQPVPVEFTELHKGGGSVKCCVAELPS